MKLETGNWKLEKRKSKPKVENRNSKIAIAAEFLFSLFHFRFSIFRLPVSSF